MVSTTSSSSCLDDSAAASDGEQWRLAWKAVAPGKGKPVPERVAIEFSMNEALVLEEWLTRFDDSGSADFEDQAEQRILWNLASMLERQIDALFSPDYAERLEAARAAVRDRAD
jgi:hypothetical protein